MMAMTQAFADVGGGTGPSGIYIDVTNLQAWQVLVAIAGALGLSCAPWLLGLAADRVGFTKPMRAEFARQLAAKDTVHEDAMKERDRHWATVLEMQQARYADLEAANVIERDRADRATGALVEMTEVVRASTHALNSLNQVAREVTDSDRSEHAG